jgi:hypothetical protein
MQRQMLVEELDANPINSRAVPGVPEHDFTAPPVHSGAQHMPQGGSYEMYNQDPYAHADGYYDAYEAHHQGQHTGAGVAGMGVGTAYGGQEGYANVQRDGSRDGHGQVHVIGGSQNGHGGDVYSHDTFPSEYGLGRPTGGAEGP